MSPNTITLTVTALNPLKEFLATTEFATDDSRIGGREVREFSLYLSQIEAWIKHPFIRPRAKRALCHCGYCELST